MKSKNKSLQIINALKKVLTTQHGKLIHSVILFGSQATGRATRFSDFDVLIVLNENYNWKFERELSKLLYLFELRNDIFIDAHFISVEELNFSLKGKDSLFINALKNGIYAK